jgi:glucuronate isomerase
MAVENPANFKAYIDRLAEVSGVEIRCFDDVLAALQVRHDFFESIGCRLSDHGIEEFYAEDYTHNEIESLFQKVYGGAALSKEEIKKYKTAMMVEFAIMDHKSGWTQQFHYGAIRDNNSRMFAQLGPDTGFDSINDLSIAEALSAFMNHLEYSDVLPKTILYTLNPKDNYVLGTMLGNFQKGPTAAKIQFGSGWWFNDQRDGMVAQMTSLANLGMLSRFVGMLTDSRSFVSYPRHEYFRRILCNLIGAWVEDGEYPADYKTLEEIVKGICYYNAKTYFNF